MRLLESRRRRREFKRLLTIANLEAEVGITSGSPILPDVRIVRNPNGFPWAPWVALGFDDDFLGGTFEGGYNVRTYATTKRACVAKARARLWEIWLAKNEEPVRVAIG